MMKTYKDIQAEIDVDFNIYLLALFNLDGDAIKYFYWTLDYFKNVGGLSFQYFQLSAVQKAFINSKGKKYFNDEQIGFSVNRNSHRDDLTVNNLTKIFTEKIENQTKRYEYIKEFCFWKILEELSLTKESRIPKDIVNIQKNNFLLTYAQYLLKYTNVPKSILDKGYIQYIFTSKGEDLVKKLDELDREYIFDTKTGKEIKKTIINQNPALRKKIANLFTLKEKEEDTKIQFVFSINGGGEKEELRELLEIMGEEKTGKLYRGQANSSWNLDASITREPKYLNNEAEMYYEILSLKPDAFKNDISVYERLITMQHFGMPTRLLDITRNPLVAIFFACNNWECKDNDGVIFTFKSKNKSDFLNFEDPRLEHLSSLFNHNNVKETDESKAFLSKIWYIKGVAKNQRISNQSGDFIFVGKGDEVTKELHQFPKMTIVIDAETKKVLLEQLESLNIHGGAVYPDLTHMSNYISNKYKNDTKSVSVSELVKDLISEEKTETKPKKKPIKKVVKIKTFDFKKLKGKDRETQLNSFAKFYNLDKDGLDKIVIDFLFSEKRPFRDEIKRISIERISVIKDKAKIDLIIDKITTLAKIVGEE